MTLEDKRDILNRFCSMASCAECVLCIPDKWENPFTDSKPCLYISNSPEADLDEALRIIGYENPNGVIEKPSDDPVNHPSHYTSGGIECLDAMAASMTPLEFMGYLKGAIIKYVWRYRLKGKPVEDLKKARFYLDKLIEYAEKEGVSGD